MLLIKAFSAKVLNYDFITITEITQKQYYDVKFDEILHFSFSSSNNI